MNILILSEADALALIERQTGQHRLAPVRLTDGRYFLSADVLTESESGIYAGQLIGVTYELAELESVKHLLEVHDEI